MPDFHTGIWDARLGARGGEENTDGGWFLSIQPIIVVRGVFSQIVFSMTFYTFNFYFSLALVSSSFLVVDIIFIYLAIVTSCYYFLTL